MIAETPDPTVEPVQLGAQRGDGGAFAGAPLDQHTMDMVKHMLTSGMPPEKVADYLKQKGLLP